MDVSVLVLALVLRVLPLGPLVFWVLGYNAWLNSGGPTCGADL